MLSRIILEIIPQIFGKCKLIIYPIFHVIKVFITIVRQDRLRAVDSMQYVPQLMCSSAGKKHVAPIKVRGARKADDYDAFSVLGSEVTAIDYFCMHIVTEFILQSGHNDLEGVSLIMRLEIFYVF